MYLIKIVTKIEQTTVYIMNTNTYNEGFAIINLHEHHTIIIVVKAKVLIIETYWLCMNSENLKIMQAQKLNNIIYC